MVLLGRRNHLWYPLLRHPLRLTPQPFWGEKHQENIKKQRKQWSGVLNNLSEAVYTETTSTRGSGKGTSLFTPSRALGTPDLSHQPSPAKNCRSQDSRPEFLQWVMGCVSPRWPLSSPFTGERSHPLPHVPPSSQITQIVNEGGGGKRDPRSLRS